MPNPKSFFSPISGPYIYRALYGPDIAKNIGIYGYRDQKTSISFLMSQQCVCNIAIYRYRVPAAPPPPACRTGPDSDSEATVQALQLVQPLGPQLCRPKGQCLGYCLHPCAQRATAEKGPGLGWCHILLKTQNLKLELLNFKLPLS